MSLEHIAKTNFHRLPERLEPYDQAFVQAYVDGKPYLRIGNSTHPGVLYRFLEELGPELVPATALEQGRLTVPDAKGEHYEAVGMGLVEIFMQDKKALFGGSSMIYGQIPNQEHLTQLQEQLDGWTLEIKPASDA